MVPHAAATALDDRIEALDPDLFSFVPMQAIDSDARALLALHAAVAAAATPFAYLEIGSFRGGSLQALVADPRCSCLMSIDPRTTETPDETRGAYTYVENTTASMLEGLSRVPGADMSKLSTFETTTVEMSSAALPQRPDCCFVDGEHTDEAVLTDARFCAEALEGAGVIAFHDWGIVRSAIKAFIRERRRDISFALAINRPYRPSAGFGVFALELGDNGALRYPALERATGARSYAVWAAANRSRHSAVPLLVAWHAMTAIDSRRPKPKGWR
ncbi:MAG TPA: class I SAM-dependent methyltransferase [Gaiellaceae bacterium]|nr:class I SAM-dependent methyltransferase [Gaiellaceae bacterium]